MKIEIGNICVIINPGPVPAMSTNTGALVRVTEKKEGTRFNCELLSGVIARCTVSGEISLYEPGPDAPMVLFDAYQLYPLAPTPADWHTLDETLEWAGFPPNIKIAHSVGKTRLSNEALRRIEQDIAQQKATDRLNDAMDKLMNDPRLGKFIKPRPRLS